VISWLFVGVGNSAVQQWAHRTKSGRSKSGRRKLMAREDVAGLAIVQRGLSRQEI
jgi:hypothetical protein